MGEGGGGGGGQWSGTAKRLVEVTGLLQRSPYLDHDVSIETRYSYFTPEDSLCEADVRVRVYVEPIPLKYTTVFNLGSNEIRILTSCKTSSCLISKK